MGVSLSSLVKGSEISLEDLKGRKIAIDAYNTVYQFRSIIRDRFTGEPLRDSQGRITSHLSGLFYRTINFLDAGIIPIYVFDGRPPEFKKATMDSRMKIRSEAERKWKEALEKGDVEKVRLYSQGSSRFTKEMVEESKHLLSLMGVSWIQAPSEGEAQATHMLKKGQAWAIGSQDWDSLMFGAGRMVKNMAISGRRKVAGKEKYRQVSPELIELDSVLSSLEINQDQLICLGILVGTDYNPGGIQGIGPKTALKLVREFKTPERIFSQVEWNLEILPMQIFDFFQNPPVEDVQIRKERLSSEKLVSFLSDERGFSRERIESGLKKLEKAGEPKQSGLDKWARNS